MEGVNNITNRGSDVCCCGWLGYD